MDCKQDSSKSSKLKRPYSEYACDSNDKTSAYVPDSASHVSISASASSCKIPRQTPSGSSCAASSASSNCSSPYTVCLNHRAGVKTCTSPQYDSDSREHPTSCHSSAGGVATVSNVFQSRSNVFQSRMYAKQCVLPFVVTSDLRVFSFSAQTSDPRCFSPVVTSDPRCFSPVVTSDPRVFSPIVASDPRVFSPFVTSDPRAFSPMVTAAPPSLSSMIPPSNAPKLHTRVPARMSYSSFMKKHSSMPRSHSPGSSQDSPGLLGYSPTSPDFSAILRGSSPDRLRPKARKPKRCVSAMSSDDEEEVDASAAPMLAVDRKSAIRSGGSKGLQTKLKLRRSTRSSDSALSKIDPPPPAKRTLFNPSASETESAVADPPQRSQTDASEFIDLTLDSDDEAVQPQKTVEPDPAIKRFPACEPGSSMLPFSMCLEKVFESWTDPVLLSTQRRNKCTIRLAVDSPERAAVSKNFLRSFKEGSMKLADEISKFGDSTASYVDSRLRNNPKIVVKNVHRVQNKQNEESFALHIRHLAGDDLENLDSIKHERVWHGTSAVAFDIAKNGFNRSKTIADAYGKGVYLSPHGNLAAHHALNKGRKTGYIIACKMASTKIGNTSSWNTEPKDGCDCGGSGDDYNAWIRVSFKDSQVIPEYILEIEIED